MVKDTTNMTFGVGNEKCLTSQNVKGIFHHNLNIQNPLAKNPLYLNIFSNVPYLWKLVYDESFEECPLFYDDVLCWPPTPTNSTHSIPCTIALQTLLNEYHVISEDGKLIFGVDVENSFVRPL